MVMFELEKTETRAMRQARLQPAQPVDLSEFRMHQSFKCQIAD